AFDVEPPGALADLIEALVVLDDATTVAREVRFLFLGWQHARPLELTVNRVSARLDGEVEPSERLDDLDAHRSAGGLEPRTQRTRHAQVVLAPLVHDDEAAVDHVHVVVDAERELQRSGAVRLVDGEPVAIEEPRIA